MDKNNNQTQKDEQRESKRCSMLRRKTLTDRQKDRQKE